MSEELRAIMTSRIAVPLVGVLSGFLTISSLVVGAVVFATTVANQTQQNTAALAEAKAEIRALQQSATDTDTRTLILEDRYNNILGLLGEMRLSFEKLETRFNIK